MNDRCDAFEHEDFEERVQRFLDGELPGAYEPEVFAHLASCMCCRAMFNHVMRFRNLTREENLAVPPGVDIEFFRKLEHHKRQLGRFDRANDRRPLWHSRRLVSLRTAVLAAVMLIGVGLLMPSSTGEAARSFGVRAETETVEFRDVIYVIYPGLTVEAAKL